MVIADIDVAVLAGGLGTRLRDVLPETPKILAPILGQPFLGHLLNWLVRQGARRVVLSLGYRAEEVVAFLQSHEFGPLEIQTVVEPRSLGTGGAIAFARPVLNTDPILVMNGDTIVDISLDAFCRAYFSSGAEASILCTQVENAGRYGQVEIDSRGRVYRFAEKDSTVTGTGWINAGAYLFGRSVLERIFALTEGSLERDILEKMPQGALHAFCVSGRFLDIGTPQSLALASEVLAS